MKATTPAKFIGITLPFIMTLGLAAMTPVAAYAAETTGTEQAMENSIQNIDYSVQAGGKIVLKITLKNPIQSIPAGFAINNPPRIAMDFLNTTNSVGKNTVNVDEGVFSLWENHDSDVDRDSNDFSGQCAGYTGRHCSSSRTGAGRCVS